MERCVSPADGNGSVAKVRASPDSAYLWLARMPKTLSRFKFKLAGAPESKSRGPLLIFKLG